MGWDALIKNGEMEVGPDLKYIFFSLFVFVAFFSRPRWISIFFFRFILFKFFACFPSRPNVWSEKDFSRRPRIVAFYWRRRNESSHTHTHTFDPIWGCIQLYTGHCRLSQSNNNSHQHTHSKCNENISPTSENRILLKSMQSKAIKTMKKQNKLKFISVDDFIHRQLVWLSLASLSRPSKLFFGFIAPIKWKKREKKKTRKKK